MGLTSTQLKAKIAEKLADYEDTSTWTPQDGTYDAATGAITGASAAVSNVGCFPDKILEELIDGVQYRHGDMKLTVPVPVAGLSFTPSDKHRVTYRSQDWQVVGVSPLIYQSVVVAYDAHLRR